VGPVMVVQMQPVRQGGGALLVAAVDLDRGPLTEQGAVEPLDLAVGLGPVGPGALVDSSAGGQSGGEQAAGLARRVVGQDLLELED
jgi:hypothetical protein